MAMEYLRGKDLSTVMRALRGAAATRCRRRWRRSSRATWRARCTTRTPRVLPGRRAGRHRPPRRDAVEHHAAVGGRREDPRLRHRQGGGAGARPRRRRRGSRAAGKASSRTCRPSRCAAPTSITVRTSSRWASCCGRWSRGSGCSRATASWRPCATCSCSRSPSRRGGATASRPCWTRSSRARWRAIRQRAIETAEAMADELDRFLVETPDRRSGRSRSCSSSCSARAVRQARRRRREPVRLSFSDAARPRRPTPARPRRRTTVPDVARTAHAEAAPARRSHRPRRCSRRACRCDADRESALVVAVVVIASAGWLIGHRDARPDQSSSARSVSTSR